MFELWGLVCISAIASGVFIIWAVFRGEEKRDRYIQELILTKHGEGCFGTTVAQMARRRRIEEQIVSKMDKTGLLLYCCYGSSQPCIKINLLGDSA